MTDAEKDFLGLRYGLEMSNDEIAKMLNITSKAVSDRYARLLNIVTKVSACADQNAAIALFKENGADVTATDLANLGTLLKALNDNDGELPDEVAEQVAGGAFDMSNLGKILGAIGDFMKALESPITTLVSLFSGETPSSGGSDGNKKQA